MTFLFVYFVLFVVNGFCFVVFGALERAWRPVNRLAGALLGTGGLAPTPLVFGLPKANSSGRALAVRLGRQRGDRMIT